MDVDVGRELGVGGTDRHRAARVAGQAAGDQAGRQKPLLLVRSTAPRLALVARVFFENRSFELTNKSEFCRIFCQNFGTLRQGALSPHTFKNHFDSPDPDAIDYFMDELTAIRNGTIRIKPRYDC